MLLEDSAWENDLLLPEETLAAIEIAKSLWGFTRNETASLLKGKPVWSLNLSTDPKSLQWATFLQLKNKLVSDQFLAGSSSLEEQRKTMVGQAMIEAIQKDLFMNGDVVDVSFVDPNRLFPVRGFGSPTPLSRLEDVKISINPSTDKDNIQTIDPETSISFQVDNPSRARNGAVVILRNIRSITLKSLAQEAGNVRVSEGIKSHNKKVEMKKEIQKRGLFYSQPPKNTLYPANLTQGQIFYHAELFKQGFSWPDTLPNNSDRPDFTVIEKLQEMQGYSISGILSLGFAILPGDFTDRNQDQLSSEYQAADASASSTVMDYRVKMSDFDIYMKTLSIKHADYNKKHNQFIGFGSEKDGALPTSVRLLIFYFS